MRSIHIRRLLRSVAAPVIASAVIACSGAAPTDSPGQPSGLASAPSSGHVVASPSPLTATGAKAAIVGEWVGVLDCERIVAMLKAAKLEAFINDTVIGNGLIADVPEGGKLKDATHPCVGAAEQAHSHFFTAAGAFGSKDARGYQVDDAKWQLEGDRLVIADQSFGYKLEGDRLTLTPPKVDLSTCTTKACRSAAVWALLVAMPGQTWTRAEITP